MFNPFNTNFLISLKDNATSFFLQLSPVVVLVLGILLAFLIISVLVNIIRGKKNIMENNDDDDYKYYSYDDEESFDEEEEEE